MGKRTLINRNTGKEVECCPNPDCLEPYSGYYIKFRVSGVIHDNQEFDGSESDNSEMYGYLNHKKVGNSGYCQSCDTKLGKVIDF